MWSLALLLAVVAVVLGCSNPDTDVCAAAFVTSSAQAGGFCATYAKSAVTATTALPQPFASACGYKSKKLSSACSCFITGGAGSTPTTTAKTTTTAKATSTSKATTLVTSITPTKTTTTVAGDGGSGATCTVTAYASIPSAVKSCTNIILSNISAPPSSAIDLQKLQIGAAVTFAGTTVCSPEQQQARD
jgi:polygalacturonase